MADTTDKKVCVTLPEKLIGDVVDFGKARGLKTQTEVFTQLLEAGLKGCPECPEGTSKVELGRNLNDYFEGVEGTYPGPGDSVINFVRVVDKNEVELWTVEVLLHGSQIYATTRGRAVGSNEPMSFGQF